MFYKSTSTFYFGLAFGWSLTFWLLTALLGGINAFPGSLLFYVGGAGPLIAALVIVHGKESRAFQKDFWIATFDPRRMSPSWLILALLIHPLIVIAAILLDVALGGTLTLKTQHFFSLGVFFSLALSVFIFGPLPEEMGWRGIALDRLQTKMSGARASLILAVAWALWHVPLFFIDGTFQQGLGAGSLRFWVFMGDIIPLTFIMTWVYNNTNRSILSAVLVHFTGNMGGALVEKTDQLAVLEFVCLTAVALVLLWRAGPDLGTIKHFQDTKTPQAEPG